MDAAAAPPARSYVGTTLLNLSRENASITAILLAVAVIVILAGASIGTARAIGDALSRYRALTAAAETTALTLQYQLDEETGIRGYAATGNRTLLAPYALAKGAIAKRMSVLRADLLAAGRSDLLPSVDRLASLNARWQREVATPALRAHGSPQTSSRELHGKAIVDEFRATASALDDRLRSSLRALSEDLSSRLRTIALISALLIAGAIIVVAGIARARALAQRRLQLEHEQREATERAAAQLQTLIEAIPHIVWIASPEGRVTYLSDRWHAYSGTARTGTAEPDWLAAIHDDDRAAFTQAWRDALANEISYETQCRMRGADGAYRWFVTRGVPERDAGGRILRWFGTTTDVDAAHMHLENVERVADAFARAQLPESLPANDGVQFHATYLAAEDIAQIGGDWYDVFDAGDQRFVFSLGDVTGHGLDAAIVMTRVRQSITALASVESDPAVILEKANRVLRVQGENMVTAVCGVFDARTGTLEYASAGHPPGLIRRSGGEVESLTSGAPPLGVLDSLPVERRHAKLNPGDMLVCYTDGIIENERDLLAGERNLDEALGCLTPEELEAPADALRMRILGQRRGRDDVAILVVARAAANRTSSLPNEHASPISGVSDSALCTQSL